MVVQRPWGNTTLGAFKDRKKVSTATDEKTRPGGVDERWGHGEQTDEDLLPILMVKLLGGAPEKRSSPGHIVKKCRMGVGRGRVDPGQGYVSWNGDRSS